MANLYQQSANNNCYKENIKTKLLTIFLLLFTSQVFSWSEKEFKLEYDTCIKDNLGSKTYTTLAPYCMCSVDLIAREFTKLEVKEMRNNGTFETNKNVQEVFNKCIDF